jgi:hypothetical protein
MATTRVISAAVLLLSLGVIALAQEQPQPQPAQPQQPQAQPQQPAQPQQGQPQPQRPGLPQQPQRQGFEFRQPPPDLFAETLAALGELALMPDFIVTAEQKESIQSLKYDHKLASDKWRGENFEELQKLSDEAQEARESGDREKSRSLFQKRRDLMQKGPRPEDAAKKLMSMLNEEQRKRVDERLAERRVEAEQQRQQSGFGFRQ